MTSEDLKRLEELEAAATEAPWAIRDMALLVALRNHAPALIAAAKRVAELDCGSEIVACSLCRNAVYVPAGVVWDADRGLCYQCLAKRVAELEEAAKLDEETMVELEAERDTSAARVSELEAEVVRLRGEGSRLEFEAQAAKTGIQVSEAFAEAEVARLKAIVDRLPKTADGVPVVPGADVRLWYIHPESRKVYERTYQADWYDARSHWIGNHPERHEVVWVGVDKCYSTREAAEAAKEQP